MANPRWTFLPQNYAQQLVGRPVADIRQAATLNAIAQALQGFGTGMSRVDQLRQRALADQLQMAQTRSPALREVLRRRGQEANPLFESVFGDAPEAYDRPPFDPLQASLQSHRDELQSQVDLQERSIPPEQLALQKILYGKTPEGITPETWAETQGIAMQRTDPSVPFGLREIPGSGDGGPPVYGDPVEMLQNQIQGLEQTAESMPQPPVSLQDLIAEHDIWQAKEEQKKQDYAKAMLLANKMYPAETGVSQEGLRAGWPETPEPIVRSFVRPPAKPRPAPRRGREETLQWQRERKSALGRVNQLASAEGGTRKQLTGRIENLMGLSEQDLAEAIDSYEPLRKLAWSIVDQQGTGKAALKGKVGQVLVNQYKGNSEQLVGRLMDAWEFAQSSVMQRHLIGQASKDVTAAQRELDRISKAQTAHGAKTVYTGEVAQNVERKDTLDAEQLEALQKLKRAEQRLNTLIQGQGLQSQGGYREEEIENLED